MSNESSTLNKDFTFPKKERLFLHKHIDMLFAEGDSFVAYPLRVVYRIRPREKGDAVASILISVSKKRFKRAVKRNRIKRLVREAYRLNKHLFLEMGLPPGQSIDIAFLYLKKELAEYSEIEKSILKTGFVLTEKLANGKESDENNS